MATASRYCSVTAAIAERQPTVAIKGATNMRQVDRRTKVSRRVFLRGSATAVPAAAIAAAGMSISSEAAWAQDAKTLTPHTMATLARMARAAVAPSLSRWA